MRWPWTQKFDANSFRSENWSNLSDRSRRAQMQALENSIAESQGRVPRKVIIDSSIPNGGFYSSDGKGGGTIHVSENDVHNNSFECMDTVLHEGRHAYQDDVINNRIDNIESAMTKESWVHDDASGCYITSREGAYCDYFYQPQESDAYSFAKSQMDNMSANFNNDPQYQNYIANRDYNDNMAKAEGMQKYGVDSEQGIKDAVQEKVENRYQAHQNQILNQPVGAKSQDLSSRFATDRVDGRYLTGTENTNLFNDYNDKYNNNELEFHGFSKGEQPIVLTNAGNIHGIDTWGDSEDNFWKHHGNTHADYSEIASHIPEVQDRLNAGESIESIRQDPDLKNCADAYFNENNMPEAVKYGDTYIHNDDGRHRILAAQEQGHNMPIKVVGEYTGKGESVDPSNYHDAYDIKHDNTPYESQHLMNSEGMDGNFNETSQESEMQNISSGENDYKAKTQGENHLNNTENETEENAYPEGKEQPESEDESEGEEQPDSEDESEGEEQPKSEDESEGEEQADSEDESEGEEQPEAENESEGEEQSESEDESEGEEQPEAENESEGEEQPETEDESEGEEQPESEDESEGEEQPESEDESEGEEQPESEDESEGEEQPENEDESEGEEQPENEDESEGEEQPENEDESEGEEQPENEDESEGEEQPESEDESEGEEQPESEDESEGEEQSESEDESEGEEQPESEDESEGEEQPESEDNAEGEEQPENEDESEGEDNSDEPTESSDSSGESEDNDYDYGYGY